MKKIYLAHAVLLILLGSFGQYSVTLHNALMAQFYQNMGRVNLDAIGRELPTFYYGIFSMCCFAYTMFVGLKTMNYVRNTGGVFFMGGVCFLLWATAMVFSPTHISVDEVIVAWYAYIAIMLLLTIWIFKKIETIPMLKPIGEETILDDLD